MRLHKIGGIIRHPIVHGKVTWAKRKYRKANPYCAVTGLKHSLLNIRRKVDVHHIIPCHVRPDLACDPNNMIGFIRDLHKAAGHPEGWNTWNPDVVETAVKMKLILGEATVSRKAA